MTYDIIIPTFTNKLLSEKCVYSVVNNSPDAQIIIVDNGGNFPAEGTLHVFPGGNIGWVKAANVGLSMSTAPYVVLMNDDTEVTDPAWLDKLRESFSHIPRLACVGPATDHEGQYQGRATKGSGILRLTPSCVPGGWGWDVKLSFFCVMFCREALVDVGLLDEGFSPGYGDDDDWLFRAWKRGWAYAINTDVTVLHRRQMSFGDKRGWYQARAVERLKSKWGARSI